MQLSYADVQKVKEIAHNFKIVNGTITHVILVESGRINTTYKIVVPHGNDTVSYMLQRLNTNVFKDADYVMSNALRVTKHLRSKGMESLEFVMTKDGKALYEDGNDVYRMTKFIHAEVFQSVSRPEDMKMLGEAIGQFALGLRDFDASELYETIPKFHNTQDRFENCILSALNNARTTNAERLQKSAEELDYVLKNRGIVSVIVNALASRKIRTSVTHNDPKLNNVLFDRKTNKPRCMIDLDTVMPGSILYDLADAIRYSANTASEEETDISKVSLDLELLKAFFEGFSEVMQNEFVLEFLSDNEKMLLPYAIKLMPLELGMRFLTDYYDGDVYFKVSRPDHNLDRARVQFALAKDIDKKMCEIEELVNKML